jgi:DNA-binding CsgD family transcriptional regulator
MPAPARAHRRAESAAARACTTAADTAALAAALVDALAAVADVQGACFHTADPATGVPTSSIRTGSPPGDFERSLEFEYRRPDVASWAELVTRSRPVAALSRETAGAPKRSARFREMLAPEGCADELRVVLGDPFGVWGYLTVFSGGYFGDEDVALAVALVPHAAGALRRLRAAGTAAAPVDDDRPAVVVLGSSGELRSSDPRALARLDGLGSSPAGTLPAVVQVLAGRARQHAGADPPPTARVRAPDGRWWLLDASPLGEDVAIVIQPAPDHALLDDLLRAYGVTPREREVAALAVAGQRTETIAARLHLSPWTVQDHLKSVFDKADVRNRGDLATLVVSRSLRSRG